MEWSVEWGLGEGRGGRRHVEVRIKMNLNLNIALLSVDSSKKYMNTDNCPKPQKDVTVEVAAADL